MELDVRKLVISFLFFGLILFLSYQLLKDPPLKCAIPSAHNKSRLHVNLVHALTRTTLNGNLILGVPLAKAFSRRNPIVSCMTTTASRVAKLQPVLLSVAKQRPHLMQLCWRRRDRSVAYSGARRRGGTRSRPQAHLSKS